MSIVNYLNLKQFRYEIGKHIEKSLKWPVLNIIL